MQTSDGIIGPDTVRAVMQAQTGLGIEADGYPDMELLCAPKNPKTLTFSPGIQTVFFSTA